MTHEAILGHSEPFLIGWLWRHRGMFQSVLQSTVVILCHLWYMWWYPGDCLFLVLRQTSCLILHSGLSQSGGWKVDKILVAMVFMYLDIFCTSLPAMSGHSRGEWGDRAFLIAFHLRNRRSRSSYNVTLACSVVSVLWSATFIVMNSMPAFTSCWAASHSVTSMPVVADGHGEFLCQYGLGSAKWMHHVRDMPHSLNLPVQQVSSCNYQQHVVPISTNWTIP